MKKLLSYLFAILIAFPTFSNENELFSGDLMFYLFEPEGEAPYAVVAMTTTRKSTYDIPESVTKDGKDYPVKEIGYMAFYGKSYLTSIIIPNSVTTIGVDAFGFCEALTSVTIPNSVTNICDRAFEGTGLRDLILPPSVTSVGGGICNCYKIAIPSTLDPGEDAMLAEVSVTYPVDNYVFDDNCIYSVDKSILYYASANLSGNYTIPSTVSKIDDYAFAYCKDLTSVTLPNSVTAIGDYAFAYCEGLTSISIPNSVIDLGDATFSSCKALTSITIPNSVTAIGNGTFSNCEGLTSVTIPNSVTAIGKRAFYYCFDLAEVALPSSVNFIGEEAFFYNGLKELIIPPSVASIGKNICCEAKVAIPSTLDAAAFDDAIVISYPAINNFFEDKIIYSSDKSAIYYASIGLSGDCIIPSTVCTIGAQAFYRCKGMTSVSIPNSVTTIGDKTFYATGLTELILPPSVTSIGKEFCNCYKVAIPSTLTFDHSNVIYYPVDNYLVEDKFIYSSDKSTIYYASVALSGDYTVPPSVDTIGNYAFSFCMDLNSVSIPGSVTKIGNGAFAYCYGLKSVSLPNSVTTIGDRTFTCCYALTSISIPNSVTTIGEQAFSFCRKLTEVDLPNYLTEISNGAFWQCSALTSVSIPNSVTAIGNSAFGFCSALTSVSIPNSVTAIGEQAFVRCEALTEVIIPDSVTKIGYGAFAYCSDLTSLTIPGSVTEIGASVFYGCDQLAEINYMTDSPIAASKDIFDDGVYDNATLNMAVGGLDKARTVEPWMYFANIQEKDFDQSGITDVTVDRDNDAPAEYYDLRGVRIVNPERGGLYIVRRGNKTTKEVIR